MQNNVMSLKQPKKSSKMKEDKLSDLILRETDDLIVKRSPGRCKKHRIGLTLKTDGSEINMSEEAWSHLEYLIKSEYDYKKRQQLLKAG